MDHTERQRKQRQLQDAISEAIGCIERAKLLANELDSPFEILGRTYAPLKVVKQGGTFDHESWAQSPVVDGWTQSDDWNASGSGSGC